MSNVKHRIFVGADEVVGISDGYTPDDETAVFSADSRLIYASSRLRHASEQNN